MAQTVKCQCKELSKCCERLLVTNNYFIKTKRKEMNILRERYQFHHRQQQLNETIEEYAAQLQRMASSCQFNGDKESFIRDHVLFGLSNQNITLQVIELGGNPSLIEIVEICVRLNDTEPATGNDYYMRGGESNVNSGVNIVESFLH